MQKIMVVLGSTRPGRQGQKIHDWFKEFIEANPHDEATFDFVDLADYNLPLLDEPMPAMFGNYQHEHTKKWSEKVAAYDGYIFVIPEYNHAAPAAVKNALDFLYKEWVHKPIGFVSYGYHLGVRAAEQLRTASINLEMAPVNAQVEVDLSSSMSKDGEFTASDYNKAQAKKLVEDIVWWSKALSAAR